MLSRDTKVPLNFKCNHICSVLYVIITKYVYLKGNELLKQKVYLKVLYKKKKKITK